VAYQALLDYDMMSYEKLTPSPSDTVWRAPSASQTRLHKDWIAWIANFMAGMAAI